jgi:hypothetical protein
MDGSQELSRSARVFISCGQSKRTDEVETAQRIAKRLRDLGFDPYIAVEEQTLRGLRENIFARLEESEYFVFVDFKREQLAGIDPPLHRGSLFSHQELALASYLELPLVAFQETEVKPEDGMLRFLQANPTRFTDRHSLPNVIADEVRRRGWDPRHRHELALERSSGQYFDHLQVGGETGRFFHVAVHNLHRFKTATSCYVYLERATRLDPPAKISLRSVEFKWAGYIYPSVNIPPRTERRFDAFYILHSRPTQLLFRTFSDSMEYIPQIQGAGMYELCYLVVSENFPPSRACLMLTLSETLDRTTLASEEGAPTNCPGS